MQKQQKQYSCKQRDYLKNKLIKFIYNQQQLFRIIISVQQKSMKAIYKQHLGFEHLNTIHSSANQPQTLHTASFLHPSQNNNQVQDTSTKKYPNNKYYQFDDEDSSGRKYIKQKLNLYADGDGDEKQNICTSLCINENGKSSERQGKNRSQLSNKLQSIKYEQYRKYFKPKQNKTGTKQNLYKSTNKSLSRSKIKNKGKKISASISTVESKCPTKCNVNSSRYHYHETEESNTNQLKHYKKLCLDMRKKNCQLTRQLQQCKEQNKKSIAELQKKVQKISQKYQQRRQHVDNEKTEKIMESLKTIKGKLNKKQNSKDREQKKFYQFFVESLGILVPQGQETGQKFTNLQVQLIWKHILQYLITNDYKLDKNIKIKTIR